MRLDAVRHAWDQHRGRQRDERLLLWTWFTAQTWAASTARDLVAQ
jgi:hypothetical protein